MSGIFHKLVFQALLHLDTKKMIIKKINGVDRKFLSIPFFNKKKLRQQNFPVKIKSPKITQKGSDFIVSI